jgi:hypothetical protein
MLVERERIGQRGSRLPFGYYLEKDFFEVALTLWEDAD